MRYCELLELAPGLEEFTRQIPEELDGLFQLKTYPAHTLIHQKDSPLERIGILLQGTFRVVNEFENGNVFMIEVNEAVSFIGEVTLLAGAATTSVTIETVTDCLAAGYIPVVSTVALGIDNDTAYNINADTAMWPPSCTAPATAGESGCSTPPSTCC